MIETQKEDLLVVQRDYPANKEEEEALQEGQVITHKGTCSDIRESVIWFVDSHEGTIRTTSRISLASWLGINEFSGGGSKMLEDNLLVSPI